MPNEEWIKQLFQSIDALDAKAFAGFITEQGQFRYGSQPAVRGREAIETYIAGFFSTLKSLRHENIRSRSADDAKTLFIGGDVVYILPNEAQVTIAFLNHFTMVGDKVQDYLVYTDPSPMAAAAG